MMMTCVKTREQRVFDLFCAIDGAVELTPAEARLLWGLAECDDQVTDTLSTLFARLRRAPG